MYWHTMFRFIINDLNPAEFENLRRDLGELLIVLGLPILEDKFLFDEKNKRIVIDLAPSMYKAIKNIIYDFFSQSLLLENTFAMKFTAAQAATENQEIIKMQLQSLRTAATDYYIEPKLSATCLSDTTQLDYQSILPLILSQGIKAVIIAEGSHDYYAPKKFILDNIAWLRQNQAIVVLENFVAETCQLEMDSCVAKRSYSALLRHMTPSMGKTSMHHSAQEFYGKKFEMMQVLCENGIPLVAGDTEASNSLGATPERLSLGNFTMVQNTIIFLQAHTALTNPFIIYFTGLAHARTKGGTPGVAELTNAITLELHDEYNSTKASAIEITTKGNIRIKRNLDDLKQVNSIDSNITGLTTALETSVLQSLSNKLADTPNLLK